MQLHPIRFSAQHLFGFTKGQFDRRAFDDFDPMTDENGTYIQEVLPLKLGFSTDRRTFQMPSEGPPGPSMGMAADSDGKLRLRHLNQSSPQRCHLGDTVQFRFYQDKLGDKGIVEINTNALPDVVDGVSKAQIDQAIQHQAEKESHEMGLGYDFRSTNEPIDLRAKNYTPVENVFI